MRQEKSGDRQTFSSSPSTFCPTRSSLIQAERFNAYLSVVLFPPICSSHHICNHLLTSSSTQNSTFSTLLPTWAQNVNETLAPVGKLAATSNNPLDTVLLLLLHNYLTCQVACSAMFKVLRRWTASGYVLFWNLDVLVSVFLSLLRKRKEIKKGVS